MRNWTMAALPLALAMTVTACSAEVTSDGKAVFYPRAVAPVTGGELQWKVSKGIGTVYSTTVVYYKNEPPLTILLAYARLVGIPVEQIIDDEFELTI